MTERIVVVEDNEPRIPGEFTQNYMWNGYWPAYCQRLTVDLPDSFAHRLRVNDLGTAIPQAVTSTIDPKRQRLEWEKFNTPGSPVEDSAAPANQTGPMVWLSTLKDWDELAAWYSGLVKGTDALDASLKAQIDSWTKNAGPPQRYSTFFIGM